MQKCKTQFQLSTLPAKKPTLNSNGHNCSESYLGCRLWKEQGREGSTDKRGETVEQSSELWEELPGCGVRTDAAASCGHQHNSDRIYLKAAGHFQKNFNADIQPDIYF